MKLENKYKITEKLLRIYTSVEKIFTCLEIRYFMPYTSLIQEGEKRNIGNFVSGNNFGIV